MPTIDMAQLVHDTLVDTYVRVRGEKPEGGFWPNDATLLTIQEGWRGEPREKIVRFLQDSIFAHMARTEITRTPYFVNSHLFAQSALDYVEKHKAYLRSFYDSGYEPRRFEQSVFGAVLASEIDYLDTFGNSFIRSGALPQFDFIKPSVWWMIWCDTFERLRMSEFPASWTDQKLMHEGVRQTAAQLITKERARLKDRHRRDVAEKAARDAMREAAMGWAGRHRAVRVLYEDGHALVASDSPVQEETLLVGVPLDARDIRLFEAVKLHGRQRVAHPAHGSGEVREAEHGKWRERYQDPVALAKLHREDAQSDDA